MKKTLTPYLNAKELSRKFFSTQGKLTVFENLSFSASKGETIAFLGPSGCGKSTIIEAVAGLIEVDGHVSVNNENVKQLRRDKRIGLAFQAHGLITRKTAFENVILPSTLGNPSNKTEAKIKANELLQMMGLSEFADYYPDQLSGGMKQRISLARALLLNPLVLLLDEPFSALDELNRLQLIFEFDKILKKEQTTTVLITHSIEEAVFLANKIYILSPLPTKIIKEIPVDQSWSKDWELFNNKTFLSIIAECRKYLFMAPKSLRFSSILFPILTGIILILIWTCSIRWFGIRPYILPAPEDILNSLKSGGWDVVDNFSITFVESLLGMLLGSSFGFIAGLCMAEFSIFKKIALPYLLASNAIPVIAIAPIIMIWFKNPFLAKVMVSAFISFFPIVLNTHRGLIEYEDHYRKLFFVYNASRLDFLLKFKLGNAVPYILTGLKLNSTLSVIGAIIGEFVSSNKGIGFGILQASYNFNSPRLWLYVGFACITGLTFYTVIYMIEKIFLFKSKNN